MSEAQAGAVSLARPAGLGIGRGLPSFIDLPQHGLALFGQHDHPVADLVDVAKAADAQAGPVVEPADADAGRRRAAGEQPLPLGAAALAGEEALSGGVVHDRLAIEMRRARFRPSTGSAPAVQPVLAGDVLCAERDMVREFGDGRRSLLSSWLS